MPAQPSSLRRTAIVGAVATGGAQAAKVTLQIISTVILSRLLLPTDFGAVAMVAPLVAFVSLFQDLGLQQAIIQARDVTAAQISRMFWLNLGMSCVIAAALVLLGPAAGWFYHDRRVVLLTMAWALPLLLGAIAAQHLALLNRALRFRMIAALDVLSSLAALAAGVAVAWLFRSYWALWVSSLVGAAVTAAGSWLATGWFPDAIRTRADTRHLLRFGLNLAGFNFMNFFSRNLDNVIVAKAFGPVPLGFYDRSYKLLLSPLQNVNAPVGRVVLPLLAQLRDEPARYRAAYMRAAGLVTFVCVPGIAALAIVAHDFVSVLLGARWAGAAPIFAWLGLAGICQPLGNATGWLFVTQHRTREMFHWGMFATTTTIASFFIGIPWGVTGVAAAYAIGTTFVRQPLLLFWVGWRGPVGTRDLMLLQLPVAVSSLLCLLIVRAVAPALALPPILMIGGALTLSYGLALATLLAVPATRAIVVKAALALVARLRGRAPRIAASGSAA